jgi:LmbE family N-acetylglucosaminyl deacetylase
VGIVGICSILFANHSEQLNKRDMEKAVLILAPHTDDGELGCGGSIHRLIQEGHEVHYVVFSICSRSLPPDLPPDTLAVEVRHATQRLGIPNDQLHLYDFDVRDFDKDRQAILQTMIDLRARIKPNWVFLPSPTDIHQDHQVVSAEGVRAFKHVNILGYEMPWNNLAFNTRYFLEISTDNLEAKIQALSAYKSQEQRPYFRPSFIRGLAETRGVQIGASFAESFEVIRMVNRL